MPKSASRQSDFEVLLESVDQSQQSGNMQSHGLQFVQEVVVEGGDLSGYQLARDKSRREIKTPICYAQVDLIAYAFNVGDQLQRDKPTTFEEACQSDEKDLSLITMKEEMSSLMKNKTWKLVEKPR